jgi:tetratricopeptide (TPR) repeat protein
MKTRILILMFLIGACASFADDKCELSRVIRSYENGVEKEAIEAYEALWKENEKLPVDAYIYLGNYYTGKRMREEAAAAYRKGVYLSKRDFQSEHNVAMIYRSLGKNEAAVTSLKRTLDIFFNGPIKEIKFDKVLCDVLASVYLFGGKSDDAIGLYLKAVKLFPADIYFYKKLCAIYVSLKRCDEGILLIEKALKTCPDGHKAELYNLSGNCYYGKGDYDRANNEYVRALFEEPDNCEYSFNLGKARIAGRYYAMGRHYLKKAGEACKDPCTIKEIDEMLGQIKDL